MEINRKPGPWGPRSITQADCMQGQVYSLVDHPGQYFLCARVNGGNIMQRRMILLSSGNRQSDAENPLERYIPVKSAVLHIED